MSKNRVACIACIALLLTGCPEQQVDFAGFSFDVDPSDLESQGFSCKEADNKNVCTNPNTIASVFGTATKGVSVTFLEGEKNACCIAAEIQPQMSSFYKLQTLRSYISNVYTHMPEKDLIEEASSTQSWRRPDGTRLSLIVIEETAGKSPKQTRFVAYKQ
jgi:hypothetical protein